MKKFKPKNQLVAACAPMGMLLSTMAAYPTSALAQDSANVLEEVVVTARKREESLQEVPQAVSVLTTRDINVTFTDIRDAEFAAPNLIIESGNANTSSMSIRGVSLSDLEKSFDPAVGVMIDDVYLGSTTAGLLSTFDLERIEILRGPQGTLQGKNTTGGVVKLVRTKPTGELGGKVSVAAGSDDLVEVKGMLNFPIVKDQRAGKVSYYSKDGGGYMKNLTLGGTDGDADFTSFTASLLWSPTDTFEAQYSYTRDDDSADAFPFVNSSPDDSSICKNFGGCDSSVSSARAHESPEDMPASFEVDLHILRLDWDMGNHQLTAITGYRDLDEEIRLDYDAAVPRMFLSDRPATDETLSQEIRIASNWSEKFEYVAGVFYWDREYTLAQTTHQLFQLDFYESGDTQFSRTLQETDSWSVFFQTDVHLTEKLTLIAGARYIDEEKDAVGDLTFFDANGVSVMSPSDPTPVPWRPSLLKYLSRLQ